MVLEAAKIVVEVTANGKCHVSGSILRKVGQMRLCVEQVTINRSAVLSLRFPVVLLLIFSHCRLMIVIASFGKVLRPCLERPWMDVLCSNTTKQKPPENKTGHAGGRPASFLHGRLQRKCMLPSVYKRRAHLSASLHASP